MLSLHVESSLSGAHQASAGADWGGVGEAASHEARPPHSHSRPLANCRSRREVLNSYLYSTDLSSLTNGLLIVFTLIASFLALCYTALEDWKGVFYYET